MSELLDGVGERLHAHASNHHLPLRDGRDLLGERNDLLGPGAGAASRRIFQTLVQT